jgi:hypothetical protein
VPLHRRNLLKLQQFTGPTLSLVLVMRVAENVAELVCHGVIRLSIGSGIVGVENVEASHVCHVVIQVRGAEGEASS